MEKKPPIYITILYVQIFTNKRNKEDTGGGGGGRCFLRYGTKIFIDTTNNYLSGVQQKKKKNGLKRTTNLQLQKTKKIIKIMPQNR